MRKMELLSPAGNLEKLDMALAYGADAVYLAGGAFGMRAQAANFSNEQLAEAFRRIHKAGKKGYVTVNILPRNEDLERLPSFLAFLEELSADGVILSDLGVLTMAKKHAPNIPIHVSTQASVRNVEAAKAWAALGACRIVLARELSLSEIAEIRAGLPEEVELEAFVHGSMCVSFSGRCLLSNFMTGTRDANRGECTQPCRWKYYLMEETRPGQYFPVEETKEGTYILNAKDLRMIEHLPALQKAGIASLKIEGRMKSSYYTAVTTNAYRIALDQMAKDPSWVCPPELLAELETVSHRPYCTGFYFGDVTRNESFDEGGYIRNSDVVAVVSGPPKNGLYPAVLKNKCRVGEELTLLCPKQLPKKVTLTALFGEDGAEVSEIRMPQTPFWLPLPEGTPVFSFLRREIS